MDSHPKQQAQSNIFWRTSMFQSWNMNLRVLLEERWDFFLVMRWREKSRISMRRGTHKNPSKHRGWRISTWSH
ncbi:hypothetical protein I3843_03G173600 [Carya illinoinensis]|uniref:Uncharacterized protein n=2 Tax=Carya illinoinensis TaxID=32201 RepID=A0A8T1R4T7_CARIL|nr:hypothetical protein CIPAW_03G180000 [Carya illinoinensis]KAG7988170.1 hypothetical protein I3843_03G173600 [Carya illinoinensis]